MKICYVDEAGCVGSLPATDSDIQPVLAICGVIFDYKKLHVSNEKLLSLKHKFYPNSYGGREKYLESILHEIKGTELRKKATADSRNVRRHAFGFMDAQVSLLEEIDAKLVGRVWVKRPGDGFNGKSVYTFSIQSIYENFQRYLAYCDDVGIVIVDSRLKHLNSNVAHSIYTQKFKSSGDLYDRVFELPAFAHSDNHAGIQFADFIASALLWPISVEAYCKGHLESVHTRRDYRNLKARYAVRLKAMQFRYQEVNGRWRGGITVSDAIGQKSGAELFRILDPDQPTLI